MSPLEYIKKVYANLENDFKATGNRIKVLEDTLDDEVTKYKELDELLTEYEKFIEKNEVASANIVGDQGVLVESTTEDVRQPGTEPGVPL
jgi:predicted  nucleic acid-binding Zn-ribbon protein